jgi:hypothetical protein
LKTRSNRDVLIFSASGQDSQDTTARKGQLAQNSQDRTARKRLSGHDSQEMAASTGQLIKDSQQKTFRTEDSLGKGTQETTV